MIFAVHLLCCSVLRRRGGEGGREERKKRWEERNGQGEKWVTRPDFMVKQVRKTWRNWNENKHNFVSTKKSETPLLAAIAPPPIVQVGFLLILFLRFAASAAQQLIPGFEPFHFNSAKGKEEEMSNCFCFSRFLLLVQPTSNCSRCGLVLCEKVHWPQQTGPVLGPAQLRCRRGNRRTATRAVPLQLRFRRAST